MPLKRTLAVTIFLCAGAAYAHGDVHNEAVKQRMAVMSDIAAQMKVLGSMAKGATPFDAAAAAQALHILSDHAARVPHLFQHPEMDPKSEAHPAIWENWDDFTAKADLLQVAADKAMVETPADLAQTVAGLGAACKACHADYRISKN